MDETRKRAIELMLGGMTRHPVERQRAVLLLRAIDGEERDEVRAMILAARAEWLRWLTVTQAKWRVSARPRRLRDASDVATRERYIRCVA